MHFWLGGAAKNEKIGLNLHQVESGVIYLGGGLKIKVDPDNLKHILVLEFYLKSVVIL